MKSELQRITLLIYLAGLSMVFFYPAAFAGDMEDSGIRENVLFSQFISSAIQIDGKAEPLWEKSNSTDIKKAVTCDLSRPDGGCSAFGEVRSLWDGALLYLLVDIHDPDIFGTGQNPADNDGLEIYFDLYNDKNAKYLEDDWMINISSKGEITGKGDYTGRIKAYAAAPVYSNKKEIKGYMVEAAIYLGGIPIKNNTSIGIEFCINDASSSTGKCKNKIFWSSENNKGLDDNRDWGSVKLAGYDGKAVKALDTFVLENNIKKAEQLPRGIWKNEKELDKALESARKGVSSARQYELDKCSNALVKALKGLRRKGRYPDPMDLPEIRYLPNPFVFFNGETVKTAEEWDKRREEIKDLAQYYEYGYMPGPPDAVTASATEKGIEISVTDKGEAGVITGLLTIPTVEQCGKSGPYPVIVSIDFWPMKPNDIYLKSGYAVLSITYSSVASDNYEHKGAFYSLYPYDVATGHDAGTLLAWAWGASRGVDALEYLKKYNPGFKNKLDLEKLVVTGFSRCGKAALAAGLFDSRLKVVSPGASGCGGAAVYRYMSSGNEYEWGVSPGNEVLGDKVRHQGHNSNEMLARFLNYGRIYKTNTYGYGERLPYDHHEIIAAIAPRAVLITTANDDYANNAEGDAIGLEAAKPVYKFLRAEKKLGLNIRTSGEPNPWGFGDGHWQSDNQVQNLVDFSNMVFFNERLSEEQKKVFYTNPYYSTFDKYYGGLDAMMPWFKSAPAGDADRK